MALHPVVSRSRTQASGFTVQRISQFSTYSQPAFDTCNGHDIVVPNIVLLTYVLDTLLSTHILDMALLIYGLIMVFLR